MIADNFVIPKIGYNDEVINIANDFDFTNLEVRSATKIEKFYYFYNCKDGTIGNTFILCDQDKTQKRCRITLIEGEKNKLMPRFEFFIWDKLKNKRVKEEALVLKEEGDLFVKARVELEKGNASFWKLIGFLVTVKDVELKDFDRYQITSSDSFIAEFKTKKEFEKIEELRKIFSDYNFDERLIKEALVGKRRQVVDEFRKLLEEDAYIEEYKSINGLNVSGDEYVWHHFLKSNDWLLGLNIDIRFIVDFVNRADLGVQNSAGAGSPNTDMLGISDYTLLVELKTANTEIFTNKKSSSSRANTWSFSSHFIEGVSQCLGQKSGWDKNHHSKDLVMSTGEVINQDMRRTVDPKTIFIVGNKQKELPIYSRDVDIFNKRDTLERFRRNNRNVEILTYDELYERAYFIVNSEKPQPLKFSN